MQMKWSIGHTRNLAVLLTTQIKGKEEELHSLKIALDTVQEQCVHDEGEEVYRGRRVGTCSICKYPFMTKSQVDEIFST